MRLSENLPTPARTPEQPQSAAGSLTKKMSNRIALAVAPLALTIGCTATPYEMGRNDERAEVLIRAEREHFETIGNAKRLRERLVLRAEELMRQGTEASAVAARAILDEVIKLDQAIAQAYSTAGQQVDSRRQALEGEMARITVATGLDGQQAAAQPQPTPTPTEDGGDFPEDVR